MKAASKAKQSQFEGICLTENTSSHLMNQLKRRNRITSLLQALWKDLIGLSRGLFFTVIPILLADNVCDKCTWFPMPDRGTGCIHSSDSHGTNRPQPPK